MPTTALWGEIAGVLALAAFPIYIHAILNGSTRPNRATWWIITLVGCLLASSYWAAGACDTIWIALVYVVGPLVIALLSLKYGDGKWELLDRICLAGALIGTTVWWLSNSALAALCIYMAIDFLGLLPTIYKSYSRPWTESKAAWFIAACASALNIFAIETWTFTESAYPVYLFVANGIIALIVFRRRQSATAGASTYGR